MRDIRQSVWGPDVALSTILRWSAIVGVVVHVACIHAQAFTILRYEPLGDLTFTEPSSTPSGEPIGATMRFTAFRTPFAASLARNETLTANLPAEVVLRLGPTEFYAGVLDGNAESWVRLTKTGSALSGAIWDGAELYAIEQFERVADNVVAGPAVGPTEPIIYRWADTLSTATDDVVAPARPLAAAPQDLAALKPMVGELTALQEALAPNQLINIGLLADSEFVQGSGGIAEVHMLAVANVVDGIFSDQVGVRINVAELRTYTEPDAFSGTDASALLSQLGAFKFDTPELRGQGLVHLLTRRELDEPPGTPPGARLLGIANLGAICHERLGASLTQYTNGVDAAIVVAHEIGHNFGAPHDAEQGSPCQSTPDGFLMQPFLTIGRQFSACSLQHMAPVIAAATCLAPNASFELVNFSVSSSLVRPGENWEVEWVVVNTGQIPATDVRAEFSVGGRIEFVEVLAPTGTICSRDPASFDNWLCPIGTVAPGATLPLKLRTRAENRAMSPGSQASGQVDLKVVAAEPLFNHRNTFTRAYVTITPAMADVYADLTSPAWAPPGSKVTLTLRGGNRGPDPASESVAMMWTGQGHTYDAGTANRGTCAKVVTGEMRCELGTLASGDTFEMVVEATVGAREGGYDIRGSAGGAVYDIDGTNNEILKPFSVALSAPSAPPPPVASPPPAPPPAPAPAASGGGGGGAVDLAFLLGLLCAFGGTYGRRSLA